MAINDEGTGSGNSGELQEEVHVSKLAGFHNIIPVFYGESSVTVEYFINTFGK